VEGHSLWREGTSGVGDGCIEIGADPAAAVIQSAQ